MNKSRFFYNPHSRRHFFKLTATQMIALPFLESLVPKSAHAQGGGASQKPWLVFCPLLNSIHPLHFFPRLEDIPDWSTVDGDPRVKVKSLDYFGTSSISDIFHKQLPHFEEVKNYLTMVAGTGWGFYHSAHDKTNGNALWSGAAFERPTNNSNITGTVDRKIKELMTQDFGFGSCNILNTSYASGGSGGNSYPGKVSSQGPDGIPSDALTKLNSLLDAIGITPPANSGGSNGGGTPTPTPPPNGTYDRAKFLDVVLDFINPFKNSNHLSSQDRLTLESYQDRLADIKSSISQIALTQSFGPTSISIPANLGSVAGINELLSINDVNQYLNLYVKILASAITTGSHKIINIGNNTPLLENLSNGVWFPGNSHDTSHNWNGVFSPKAGEIQFEYSKGIMRHILFPLMKELISTPDGSGGNFADHGAIYAPYEHCTGNFHGGFDGGSDKETYGIPVAIFGKLKGYFNGNELYDYRLKYVRPNGSPYLSFAYNQMFNTTFFKSFGFNNPSRYATHGGDTYGYYESSCGNGDNDLCFQSAFHLDSMKFRNVAFKKA